MISVVGGRTGTSGQSLKATVWDHKLQTLSARKTDSGYDQKEISKNIFSKIMTKVNTYQVWHFLHLILCIKSYTKTFVFKWIFIYSASACSRKYQFQLHFFSLSTFLLQIL